MALPKNAILEKVLPGKIAIYDVSHILPKPTNPRFDKRPHGIKIARIFFHHSGAYGRDGYDGAKGSVNFVIHKRNFGARPYHFWLAYKPDTDKNGNLVIYRLAKNEERCWHTGGRANDEGVGIVWQGNLYPEKDGKPSDEQYKMAEAITNCLIQEHSLDLPDGLSFHAEADKWGGSKKSTCPGPFVQDWVKKYRKENIKRDPIEDYVSVVDDEIEDNAAVKPNLNNEKEVAKPKKKKDTNFLLKLIKLWLNKLFPGRKNEKT